MQVGTAASGGPFFLHMGCPILPKPTSPQTSDFLRVMIRSVLVLGKDEAVPHGGRDMALDSEVGEEGGDLFATHIFGVAFVVKEDEAPGPFQIDFFGAN